MLSLVLCFLFISVRASTVDDPHYVAAVLEYASGTTTADNLQNYVRYIAEAAAQEADIVVFPELTLLRNSSGISMPIHGLLQTNPSPALSPQLYDPVLVELSQAALDHQIYVVVNIPEQLDCSVPQPEEEACPSSGVYQFNTNVVFDRNGNIIDRYRKINLFGEYSRTPAFHSDLGIFSTDFGVTFGHFICFDLMFQIPAIQLVQQYNITDVIFPTMWFSEMPFLTAVQAQQAYAYVNDVNFLASGASRADVGSAGSGIYSGKAGALTSTMPGADTRRLLVSAVPKIPASVQNITYPGPVPNDPQVLDGLYLKRDLSLPAHVTRVLDRTTDLQQFQLTDGDVTCSFTIQLRDIDRTGPQNYYRYRAFAQDCVKTAAHRVMGVRACAVLACVNDDVTTCAQRSLNTTFEHEFITLDISLTTSFPNPNEKYIHFPTSLKNDKFPLKPEQFSHKTEFFKQKNIHENYVNLNTRVQGTCEENNYINQNTKDVCPSMKDEEQNIKDTIKLLEPRGDILTFGIWGRVFERDVDKRNEATEEERREFQEFEDSLWRSGSKDQVEVTQSESKDLFIFIFIVIFFCTIKN